MKLSLRSRANFIAARFARSPCSIIVGRASGAFVHPAHIGAAMTVDPGAVIGPRAEIGAGTLIGANAVIKHYDIGRDCAIGVGCTITHTLCRRPRYHPSWLSYRPGWFSAMCRAPKDTSKFRKSAASSFKTTSRLGPELESDRGGNAGHCDRRRNKSANLCQIGHKVVIGRHCIIVAQSGLCGSVTLEDFVMLGGRVGIGPHITIGKARHSWVARGDRRCSAGGNLGRLSG